MQGFKPLTTRAYSLWKYVVLPVGIYQVLSRCEEFEEDAIVYLAELILSQLKKELNQPNVVRAGYQSLQTVLLVNLYTSHNNILSVSNFISRLLQRTEVKNFGKSTTYNLLNKLWLKKLILDTIEGYKKRYRIKEISAKTLNPS